MTFYKLRAHIEGFRFTRFVVVVFMAIVVEVFIGSPDRQCNLKKKKKKKKMWLRHNNCSSMFIFQKCTVLYLGRHRWTRSLNLIRWLFSKSLSIDSFHCIISYLIINFIRCLCQLSVSSKFTHGGWRGIWRCPSVC